MQRYGIPLRSLIPLAALAIAAAAAAEIAAARADGTAADGDAARGEQLYESRCGGCHSLDSNRVGPLHHGVFGRRAGSVADYAYSPALVKVDLVWTAETLDRWLTNPQQLIPGQRMNVRVRQAQDRADIIAFLQQVSQDAAE